MIVAASTQCFPDLSLAEALSRMVDLEFTSVEIDLDENGRNLKPSTVADQFDKALEICRDTRRLTPVAYNVNITATGEEYYRHFAAICRLAKETKVVTIVMPSGEIGTPFNEEVERLQRLVKLASIEGALVALKTETGRVSQDPDTVTVLCDHVKGLGITLDPSHLIYGPHQGGPYEQLLKYVYHVHLRDTKKDELQVRVGQGEVEYGRLVTLLEKHKYGRALCVHITPMPEVDHPAEMRKLRLLLESLL